MPITRRRPVLAGEPGDHPGLGRAGHAADDDRVEEDAELALLLLDLVGPVGEAETAERVVRGAGRDGVRRAAARLHVLERRLPRVLEPDAEAGRVEAYVGAHDPATAGCCRPGR